MKKYFGQGYGLSDAKSSIEIVSQIKIKMFNNKSILITGGTGSLGKALTKRILKSYPEVNRIIVFSRDEQKQFQMEQEFPKVKFPRCDF